MRSLVLLVPALCASIAIAQDNVIELKNSDVLSMVAAKVPTDVIITRIQTSRCNFDTFPSVISELRYRGVPEEILVVMVDAPVGRPTKKVKKKADAPNTNVITASTEKVRQTTETPVERPTEVVVAKPTEKARVEQKILTNDDVVNLLRGGLPTADVATTIRKTQGNYDFSAQALHALQEAGADAVVFLSMMEVSRRSNDLNKKPK